MENDLSPISIFQKSIRFWWILAIMMIAGGGIGLVISRLHSPIYESKAVITSVLDYSFIDKLDDWEEDQIFAAIGEEIHSSSVIDDVITKAASEGIQLSPIEIKDSLSIGRQDTRWVLRVRTNNPLTAQKINIIWAQVSMGALAQLKENSIITIAEQKYLDSLVSCLEQSVIVEPSSALCSLQNSELLKAKIQEVSKDPALQKVWNTIAISHMSFDLTTKPALPVTPVLFRQNINSLVGMLIGLVIGIWLIAADIPSKIIKKGSR
jgi:hypothetical protein